MAVRRTVSSRLTAQVFGAATVELQVAVAGPAPDDERLSVELDGRRVELVEVVTEAGGRLHLATVPPGHFEVTYTATVIDPAPPAAVGPLDAVTYLRPSRYAQSDRLSAVAAREFSGLTSPRDLLRAVPAWVGTRLAYTPGASRGTDGAVDTLLAGEGVCRDYAHLTAALLRARDVPARLVSAYAPGLDPMDFHAVVEALVDGAWHVVDATLLAPRSCLVRLATGRDAADVAFLSSYGGEVRLDELQVGAVVDGDLPPDDLEALVRLT